MKSKFKVGDVVYDLIINVNQELIIFKNVVQKVFYNEKDGFSYALNEIGKANKKYRYEEGELYSEKELINQFNSFIR